MAIPAIAQNGVFSRAALFVISLALLAAALCYAGYGLRKARRSAGWVAIVVGAVLILVPIAYRAPITQVGILVNLLMMSIRSPPVQAFVNWHGCGGAMAEAVGGNGREQPRWSWQEGSCGVADLHWYEAAGIGQREFKIKRYLD